MFPRDAVLHRVLVSVSELLCSAWKHHTTLSFNVELFAEYSLVVSGWQSSDGAEAGLGWMVVKYGATRRTRRGIFPSHPLYYYSSINSLLFSRLQSIK